VHDVVEAQARTQLERIALQRELARHSDGSWHERVAGQERQRAGRAHDDDRRRPPGVVVERVPALRLGVGDAAGEAEAPDPRDQDGHRARVAAPGRHHRPARAVGPHGRVGMQVDERLADEPAGTGARPRRAEPPGTQNIRRR
jgi:hypothetical protein